MRVERHVENALKVVDFLNKHPKVEKVNHPSVSDDPSQQALYKKYFPNGGGSIFTFEIKGDAKTAQNFIDHLKLFSLLETEFEGGRHQRRVDKISELEK